MESLRELHLKKIQDYKDIIYFYLLKGQKSKFYEKILKDEQKRYDKLYKKEEKQ